MRPYIDQTGGSWAVRCCKGHGKPQSRAAKKRVRRKWKREVRKVLERRTHDY